MFFLYTCCCSAFLIIPKKKKGSRAYYDLRAKKKLKKAIIYCDVKTLTRMLKSGLFIFILKSETIYLK